MRLGGTQKRRQPFATFPYNAKSMRIQFAPNYELADWHRSKPKQCTRVGHAIRTDATRATQCAAATIITTAASASAITDVMAVLGAPATVPVELTVRRAGKHLVRDVQHFVLTSVTSSEPLELSLYWPVGQPTVAPAHTVLSESQQVLVSAVPHVFVAHNVS
jgi:hypothetical protein